MKKMILTAGIILVLQLTITAQYSIIAAQERSRAIYGISKIAGNSDPIFLYDLSKDSSEKKTFEFYMAKSRSKKTAAWVFLGGGALLTAIGALTFPKDYSILGNSSSKESQATTSDVLAVMGIAAMLGSIPFFISSSVNKHRAHVNLSSQKTTFGIPVKAGKKITSLTLSIPLG